MERGKNNLATSEVKSILKDTRVVEKRRKLRSFPWLPAWLKKKTTCRPPKRPTRNQDHNPLFFCIFSMLWSEKQDRKRTKTALNPEATFSWDPIPLLFPWELHKVLYGGKAPPQGPTPYPFIYHFLTQKVYLLLTNGIFHIPSLEVCIPFNYCIKYEWITN